MRRRANKVISVFTLFYSTLFVGSALLIVTGVLDRPEWMKSKIYCYLVIIPSVALAIYTAMYNNQPLATTDHTEKETHE